MSAFERAGIKTWDAILQMSKEEIVDFGRNANIPTGINKNKSVQKSYDMIARTDPDLPRTCLLFNFTNHPLQIEQNGMG